jgi:hypothetical protein
MMITVSTPSAKPAMARRAARLSCLGDSGSFIVGPGWNWRSGDGR